MQAGIYQSIKGRSNEGIIYQGIKEVKWWNDFTTITDGQIEATLYQGTRGWTNEGRH